MESLASVQGNFVTPEAKRVKLTEKEGFFSQFPDEIILKIFGYLKTIELAKCVRVSKQWKRLASDESFLNPKNLSPLMKVFDELDWSEHVDMSEYGLTTEDISPCNHKEIHLLEKTLSSSFVTEIEENAGIMQLTIPKGLTINKFVKIAALPKMGSIHSFEAIQNVILNPIGDIPVDKTYRIVITNSIFKNSRKLPFSAELALLEKIGCRGPKILEVMVLLAVTFMRSGKYLYSPTPWTYTRCLEYVSSAPLIIGSFVKDYIDIYYCPFEDEEFVGSGGVVQTS